MSSKEVDMRSQGSSSASSDGGESDDDDDRCYYQGENDDLELESRDCKKDVEYFEFACLEQDDIEKLLNQAVQEVSQRIQVTPSLAKQLLHTHAWNVKGIEEKYQQGADKLLIEARIKPSSETVSKAQMEMSSQLADTPVICRVCLQGTRLECQQGLACMHRFCTDCWATHFGVQIRQGVSTEIQCMAKDCKLLVPEDFLLNHLKLQDVRVKYQHYAFNDYVKSHPELRYCPGPNCPIVVQAKEKRAKRVICSHCKTAFCFKCGMDYHAPTDCEVIKKWIVKCADDSETANYISAHTKDCPKCHICIEKNGGCNHMQCFKCKHDFCWMCLGDWKNHGSEYYECSRYKENPNIANQSANAQAREALKKYLFYFERWENHSKSLRLELETTNQIQDRIQAKILAGEGTWIDWQYLLDSSLLLAKCRYTLQYTYPYAYFMTSRPRKELFEYQQAQLEAEIENLSWKIERAETHSCGDIENSMDICEKGRTTLLQGFAED